MRRSFRVATVFTGAAALAAGLGPTALAGPAGAAAFRPDLGQWQECGANNGGVSNWVHVYYPNDDHPAECVGGQGNHSTNATFASFCPGNNNGVFYGSAHTSAGNVATRAPFSAGQPRSSLGLYDGYHEFQHVSAVYISNWTGHAKCT